MGIHVCFENQNQLNNAKKQTSPLKSCQMIIAHSIFKATAAAAVGVVVVMVTQTFHKLLLETSLGFIQVHNYKKITRKEVPSLTTRTLSLRSK